MTENSDVARCGESHAEVGELKVSGKKQKVLRTTQMRLEVSIDPMVSAFVWSIKPDKR